MLEKPHWATVNSAECSGLDYNYFRCSCGWVTFNKKDEPLCQLYERWEDHVARFPNSWALVEEALEEMIEANGGEYAKGT